MLNAIKPWPVWLWISNTTGVTSGAGTAAYLTRGASEFTPGF
jgi:hypothetical protein